MAKPTEVLEQLLSAQLAHTLQALGVSAWDGISAVLGSVANSGVTLTATDARLVMPDEILDEFAGQHVVLPFTLTNATGQETTSWLVVDQAVVVAFLATAASDAGDVVAGAASLAGQLVQMVNATTLASASGGLSLTLDDGALDAMPGILGGMDEPCVLLDGTAEAGATLPFRLVLSGSLLDMLSSATASDTFAATAATDPAALFAEAAPVAEVAPPPMPAAPPAAPREPTPIMNAPTARRAQFSPLPDNTQKHQPANIDLLSDLQMAVSVELGRTEMSVSDVLGLGSGSVIELDRLAGEPVDILVNDRLIARGEVVVVDENFGVRIVEVLARSREVGKVS